MIVLRDDRLLVRVDPRHGGEILDLVDLCTGRQLLARTPCSTAEPREGDLSEADWVAGYRGGWQVLLPNAGNASGEHGFHGEASVASWDVLETAPREALLGWSGHGVRAVRRLRVEDGALIAETELTAVAAPVPSLIVEHVAVGAELLDPRCELMLPAAASRELDACGGPMVPPGGDPVWPDYATADGGVATFADPDIARAGSTLLVLRDVPDGGAAVRNPRTGQGLALAWDPASFPCLWLWREARATGGRWRHAAEILALEPSTVPHHGGLAEAVAHGQARWLEPDMPATSRLVVRPFVTAGRVLAVDASARPSTESQSIAPGLVRGTHARPLRLAG